MAVVWEAAESQLSDVAELPESSGVFWGLLVNVMEMTNPESLGLRAVVSSVTSVVAC